MWLVVAIKLVMVAVGVYFIVKSCKTVCDEFCCRDEEAEFEAEEAIREKVEQTSGLSFHCFGASLTLPLIVFIA